MRRSRSSVWHPRFSRTDFPDIDALESRAWTAFLEARGGNPARGEAAIRATLDVARRAGYLSLEARCRAMLAELMLQGRACQRGPSTPRRGAGRRWHACHRSRTACADSRAPRRRPIGRPETSESDGRGRRGQEHPAGSGHAARRCPPSGCSGAARRSERHARNPVRLPPRKRFFCWCHQHHGTITHPISSGGQKWAVATTALEGMGVSTGRRPTTTTTSRSASRGSGLPGRRMATTRSISIRDEALGRDANTAVAEVGARFGLKGFFRVTLRYRTMQEAAAGRGLGGRKCPSWSRWLSAGSQGAGDRPPGADGEPAVRSDGGVVAERAPSGSTEPVARRVGRSSDVVR